MSIFHDNAIAGASGNQATAYKIERSLRFNSSDSAYLSRTPASAGNRKTWTWSGWVKRSGLGAAEQNLFGIYTAANNNENFQLTFTNDAITVNQWSGGYILYTSSVYRDTSAWYHIVLAVDTTQATASNRIKLYVNGTEVTTFSSTTYPAQNTDLAVNQAAQHEIGAWGYTTIINYFSGYLADIHFIDGQALTPSSFAETNITTGQWVPKAYTGTYGTNGFRLAFADNSNNTATTLGKDSSGNGNNWTPNNLSVTAGTGSYPTSTITGSAGLTGQANVFDGTITTSATVSLSSDNFILFTPTAGISYNTSIRFYAYAANGYSITNYYSLNGGAETTFVGGGAGFNGPAWITAATGSGTLTSLKVRLTRGGGNSSSVNLYAIEVDGVILLDNRVAGINNDSLVDTPTSYGTDTGAGGEVRGNYCTWNPLNNPSVSATLSNGNLDVASNTTSFQAVTGTLFPASGKWYVELINTVTATDQVVGIAATSFVPSTANNRYIGRTSDSYGFYSDGRKIYNNTFSSYGNAWSVNDVINLAFDLDNGKVWLGINGTWQASGNPATGTNAAFTGLSGAFSVACSPYLQSVAGTFSLNAGQRPFVYTAPSGFKALCDTNLPAPVVAKPNTAFDVKLYTGNGSTQTISGLGFSPDLVWLKSRNTGVVHLLYDSVRGAGALKSLQSNTTNAEAAAQDDATNGFLSAFTSDGFSVNAGTTNFYTNNSSTNYVSWAWDAGSSTVTNTQGSITSQVRANASAGFSIVTYTGNGTGGATVGHGLGVAPGLIIVKQRSTASANGNWAVQHQSLGATKALILSATDAVDTNVGYWNNASPTSSVFSIGTFEVTNRSTATYVAYCFAPVAGYSSFGSYTGNGSTDGPFVYTGFRPRYILVKNTTGTNNWQVFDTSRNTYNVVDNYIQPNSSAAESTSTVMDILSNGFKIRDTLSNWNGSGNAIVYAAFAESPLQYARAR